MLWKDSKFVDANDGDSGVDQSVLVIYLGHLSQLHFGGELTRPRSLQVALCPYDPSETAALAFTAMIAIAAFLHLVLMFPC